MAQGKSQGKFVTLVQVSQEVARLAYVVQLCANEYGSLSDQEKKAVDEVLHGVYEKCLEAVDGLKIWQGVLALVATIREITGCACQHCSEIQQGEVQTVH
jgi:hypothetical protein